MSKSSLLSQLTVYQTRQFTGRLDIEVSGGKKWSLYLSLGQIAWAAGGIHPVRRWRRQLTNVGITLSPQALQLRQSDRFECWDYQLLTLLLQRQKITKEQQLEILEGVVHEVLWEILQAIHLAKSRQGKKTQDQPWSITPQLGVRPTHSETGILPRDWTLDIKSSLGQAEKQWAKWAKAGLAKYSPNLAPVLQKPEQLKEKTSAQVYKQLVGILKSKRSLRDLATLLKKDLLALTRSLSPYIQHDLVRLGEIPDLPNPLETVVQKNPAKPAPKKATPAAQQGVIVCVDDSPQICQTLEDTFADTGYQLIAVQEAIQALPTVIKYNPDIIFLDLMMPIANGYEICSQIRRVSQFKDTPVVILTSNDGLVDRVRAKVVGATDFLSKPVETEKVMNTVERHLKAKAAQKV
ncbi:response regulator [Spirulina sp. CS-785/01]|uniref:response regulator n=1 Tax=Spirulina sp. CS-785/01 TaxID=3021716 RepID=UPI00232DFB76|nr:response regulator [Spirulina sp. CS-785/01]MDB9311510.1 response regulator [Spirulina sp. CS-785/01]